MADKDYYNIMLNGSVLYNGTFLTTVGTLVQFKNENVYFPHFSRVHQFGDTFVIVRENYLAFAQIDGLNLTVFCQTVLPPFNNLKYYLLNHNPINGSFGSTLNYFGNAQNFVELFPYKISSCSPTTVTTPPFGYLSQRNGNIFLKHYPVTFIGSFKFNNFTYTFKVRHVKGFEIIVGRVCNLLDFQKFDLSYTSLSAYCPFTFTNSSYGSTFVSFSKSQSTVYISNSAYIWLSVCTLNLTEIDIKLNQIRHDCSQGSSTIYTGVVTSQIPNLCLPSPSVFICDSTFNGTNGAMYSNAINVTGNIILRQKHDVLDPSQVIYFERKFPNLPGLIIVRTHSQKVDAFKIIDLYYDDNSSPSFKGSRSKIIGMFQGLDPVSGRAYYEIKGNIKSVPLYRCANYEKTTCLYFPRCKLCSIGCRPINVSCKPEEKFINVIEPVLPFYAFSRGSVVSLKPYNKLIHEIGAYQIRFISQSLLMIDCTNPITKEGQIECQTDSLESSIPFNTSFDVSVKLTFQNTTRSITLAGENTLRIVDPQYSEIIPNYLFPSHPSGFQIRFSRFFRSLGHQIQIFLGQTSCVKSYDNQSDVIHVNCTYFGSPTVASLVARVRSKDLLKLSFNILPKPTSIRPLVQSLFPKAQLAFPIIGNNIRSFFHPRMAFRLNSDVSEFKNCNFSGDGMILCDSPSLEPFNAKLPFTLEVVLESHGNVLNVSSPITVKMGKPPRIRGAEFDLDQFKLFLRMRNYFSYFVSSTKIQIIDLKSGRESTCSAISFSSNNLECEVNEDNDISGSVLNVTLTVANYEQAFTNVPVSSTFVAINLTYIFVLALVVVATIFSNHAYRRAFIKKKYQKKVLPKAKVLPKIKVLPKKQVLPKKK
uniref:Uncharacterized protein n=1 Tax=Tetranychus urticae TaxID=32264 RepID=T1KNG9_TETUR